MRNLTLSNGVKKYFVHALKSLGLRNNETQPELSEAEIERLLVDPNTDSTQILSYIKEALLAQLENDRHGDQYLRRNTAFDRKAAESLLEQVNVNGLSMDATQRREYLQSITNNVQNGSTIEMLILTLSLGLNDQDLNDFEKDEALALWDDIRYADFKSWLGNQYRADEFNDWLLQERSGQGDPQSSYSCLLQKYRIKNVEKNLEDCTKRVFGSSVDVQSFLNTKIPTSHNDLATWMDPNISKDDAEIMWQKIKANESLFQSSIKFCEQRCKVDGKNPKTEFSIKDVLAAAGNSNEQLITFLQTRSKDQKIQQKNDPKNSGMTKENKIGNVMGKTGRKFVEKINDGIGASVEFDKELGMKKGKKGPWRGLQPLLEQISTFFKEVLYKYMPIIGFVQGMMESLGYACFDPKEADTIRNEEDLTQAWQTEYKPIPNACKDVNGELNAAGEFVNKLKARLLADKMQLIENTLNLDDCNLSAQQHLQTKQLNEYLDKRITTAGEILKEQEEKVFNNPNSAILNNVNYYATLESQVLDEQNNKGNKVVEDFLQNSKDKTANDAMATALQTFHRVANSSSTPNQLNAKRMMAAEMFNLVGKVEDSEINNQDLDEMTVRFLGSQEYSRISSDLCKLSPQGKSKVNNTPNAQLDSKDYAVSVEHVTMDIDNWVRNDLIQNAKYNEHNQHMTNHYRNQFVQEACMER
ncbi:MAG: hypothetical protein J5598_01175 [Clostridia bacterium]|nr:hypothetical protein [Clostridia bacterium]